MNKIKYEEWNPSKASSNIVKHAGDIIAEYEKQGLVLTLRQLYYQFVSRDLIPNTERSYKNLGATITKARLGGYLSWTAIEDRNRGHISFWSREDPEAVVKNLPNYIRFDQWARQTNYVEVWVEKEALGNVIQRACEPLLVPYLSCKGYLSSSEAWRAGQRFRNKTNQGKQCTIIHLGDHDPSGIDMTRDNDARVQLFSHDSGVHINRVALNMDQVRKYNPPENPTKLSDSRSGGYVKQYGKSSWELDALEPQVIIDLIKDTVHPLIDWDVWEEVNQQEKEVEDQLRAIGDNYAEIQKFLLGDI